MTQVMANGNTLLGTCGIGLFYGFYKSSYQSYYDHPLTKCRTGSGCGWEIAGFIPGNTTKEAYDILKKKYKIVMQSPVRRNANSGHSFFFVVYDSNRPRKSKNNPNPEKYSLAGNKEFEWPFK